MNINEIINFLKESGLLTKINLEEEGFYLFLNKETFLLALEKIEEDLFLYGVLTQTTPSQQNELLLTAIEANLYGRGTGHANFGFEPESKSLILFQRFDAQALTDAVFLSEYLKFCERFAYWLENLSTIANERSLQQTQTQISELRVAKKQMMFIKG